MGVTPAPLFCSEKCKSAVLNRSFDTCPRCNMCWDGGSRDHDRHYRNTAWVIRCCSQSGVLDALPPPSVALHDAH